MSSEAYNKFYELLRDSYNSSDFNEFCKYLSEDVVYESQWVNEPLTGKSKVSQHLLVKGRTFKEKNALIHAKVAKLVKQNDLKPGINLMYRPGEHCVVVTQGRNKMVILMEIDNGLIKRVDLCMPDLFSYELVEYPDHMTVEEIHDFGIEIVAGQFANEGYKLLEVNRNYGKYPQIIAEIDNQIRFVIVHTEVAPFFGVLEKPLEMKLKNFAKSNNAVPYFASVSIGSTDVDRFNKALAIRGDGFHASFSGLKTLK